LPGRGLGISEIQVLSSILVEDWPDKEVVLADSNGLYTEPPDEPPDEEEETSTPPAVRRLTCVPNPFNARAEIIYQTRQSGRVQLGIYNLLGRQVRQLLADAVLPAGEHRLTWDARDDHGIEVASGLYLCVLRTDYMVESARLMLVK
jgi:hypothetical protein